MDDMEDVLGESNESESDSFVNTGSKIGRIYGTLQMGEAAVSLVCFKNHVFPVCTRVNSDAFYGISFI
jgi:hypothetical protein